MRGTEASFVLVSIHISNSKAQTEREIGPNELAIFEPDILPQILDGSKNPFSKPAWYDNLRPFTGLNTLRSKVVHEHRRRVWDQGFTVKGTWDYTPLSDKTLL